MAKPESDLTFTVRVDFLPLDKLYVRFEELGGPPTYTRRQRVWSWVAGRLYGLAAWCDERAESLEGD